MADPSSSGSAPDWRLILAGALLALALAAVVYRYADALTDLAASLTTAKLGPAQGHIRY
jgi:hypothetical protein